MSHVPETPTDPVDSYLHWGLDTGFRHFFPNLTPEGERRPISLLIEWNDIDSARKARELCRRYEVKVPAVYVGDDRTPPQLAWAVAVPLQKTAEFVAASLDLTLAIELAEPVAGAGTLLPLAERALPSEHDTLFAVLDDGCAFANSRFLASDGSGTRVLAFWNQDPAAEGYPVVASMGPTPLSTFGYGAQWFRADFNDMISNAGGSQELIYQKAGLKSLRRSATHGTHVMDLLCGDMPWDIVFVQFPWAAIDDPSGRWLKRYALDGLHYILQHAGPKTKTIVANLSWGPQTGPHDGTSVVEREFERLVNAQIPLGRKLFVTLPAGNSFDSRSHAEVAYATGAKLHWILPPDGHAPAFIEVRWPDGVTPDAAQLKVTPPSGISVTVTPGTVTDQGGWYARVRAVGNGTKALVVVHPMESVAQQYRGEHGRWLIEFPPGSPGVVGEIHVYVARADHNMGAKRRAKASRLEDASFTTGRRFLSPRKRADEIPNSSIRRRGTLNGIATGTGSFVAGGYRYSDFHSSPYSSSGPTRGLRAGPNYACMTDVSPVVQGIRASGVRSGTTLRLVGTSSAAPQLGRQLVNGLNLPFFPWPLPADAIYRIGDACLWPEKRNVPRK